MSIRLRLTLYWAAVLAAVMILGGMAVLLLFQRQQWARLDSALMEEADTTAEALARMGRAGDEIAIARKLSDERDLGPARRVMVVSGGAVIADFGSRAADLPVIAQPAAHAIVEGRRGIFRYAVVPFAIRGRSLYLADGVDATLVRDSITRLKRSLIILMPMLLALCVSGGYLLAGRALVPIATLAAGLAEIEPRDLSRRLAAGGIDDEVTRLTRAINALLERVERAATAERRFAADAAHELRTPLAVLRTGLEVTLARGRAEAEYVGALQSAWREVVALCRMADDLLALSRLDHEAAAERAPLDLRALVAEVIEAVEPLVQAKSLTLESDLDGPVPIAGNASHLRRLVINLLDNALKFTPAHGRVAVALAAHDGQARLSVTDSGPGIPADDMPLIFERFFRGKTRGEQGNGLGLSLCREVVRLHGGKITASNLAGGGSEFTVTMPCAPREA